MGSSESHTAATPTASVAGARDGLDAQVREIVAWHFDPATGLPVLARLREEAGLGSAEGDPEASPT